MGKNNLAKGSGARLRFDWADYQPKLSILDSFRPQIYDFRPSPHLTPADRSPFLRPDQSLLTRRGGHSSFLKYFWNLASQNQHYAWSQAIFLRNFREFSPEKNNTKPGLRLYSCEICSNLALKTQHCAGS